MDLSTGSGGAITFRSSAGRRMPRRVNEVSRKNVFALVTTVIAYNDSFGLSLGLSRYQIYL